MKRITFIIFLIFISVSLFALDPYVEKQIDKGVTLALKGLLEPQYTVVSYEEKVFEEVNKASISILLEIEGKPYHVVIADKNLKKARKKIKDEVRNSLKYISFVKDAELTLDYKFDTSYSSVTETQLRNGSFYLAKGIDDKSYGLLVVKNEKDMDSVSIYDSLFDNGLKPGLELIKTGGNLLSFSFGLNPYLENNILGYSVALDYKNLALWYPVAPKLSFSYDKIRGTSLYLFGLGLDYYLPLSTFFASSFSLIQNSSASAGLAFILGTDGKDFMFGSQFELFYNWFINSNFVFSVGYSNLVLASKDFSYKLYSITNRIVIKGGIRF